MPRTRKTGGASAPSVPSSIRVLEDRTIAHGCGLMTFTKDTVYSEPWWVNAAVSNGIKYESLD